MRANADRMEYRSFMLRIWRAGRANSSEWRASLESVVTGERRGFAGLEALLGYLQQEVYADAPEPDSCFQMPIINHESPMINKEISQ